MRLAARVALTRPHEQLVAAPLTCWRSQAAHSRASAVPTCCLPALQVAHEQLVGTIRDLVQQKRRPPTELTRALMLLHSYILVKTLVRMGDHRVSLQQQLNTAAM